MVLDLKRAKRVGEVIRVKARGTSMPFVLDLRVGKHHSISESQSMASKISELRAFTDFLDCRMFIANWSITTWVLAENTFPPYIIIRKV